MFGQCQRQARRRACSASVNATVPKDSLVSRRSQSASRAGREGEGDATGLSPSASVAAGGRAPGAGLLSALPLRAGVAELVGTVGRVVDSTAAVGAGETAGAGGTAVFAALSGNVAAGDEGVEMPWPCVVGSLVGRALAFGVVAAGDAVVVGAMTGAP